MAWADGPLPRRKRVWKQLIDPAVSLLVFGPAPRRIPELPAARVARRALETAVVRGRATARRPSAGQDRSSASVDPASARMGPPDHVGYESRQREKVLLLPVNPPGPRFLLRFRAA